MPTRHAEDVKRRAVYFPDKDLRNAYIARLINRLASNHSVRMPQGDQMKLETWRAEMCSDQMIQPALNYYKKTDLSVQKQGTAFDLVTDYRGWQGTMNRTSDEIKTMNH